MATVLTSSGWMTNFIYEQDLTSYYMNNMLTGVLRPGVYNANLALVIDNSNNVYLSIKKGTTFLFSNSYFKVNNEYRRNFSGVDYGFKQATSDNQDNVVLIKCVAQNDILQKIADLPDLKTLCTKTGETSESVPVFVFSYMKYKRQSQVLDSIVPIFRLATKNEKNGSITDEFLYKTQLKYYSYDGSLVEPSDSSENWMIPDGCSYYDVGSRNLLDYSFLMLGSIFSSDVTEVNNFKYTLSFSGRGFPEYRHAMINNDNDINSDIIFDHNGQKMSQFYLDMNDSLISGDLINKRIIKRVYSINTTYDNNYMDTGWEYPYLGNKESENISGDCDCKYTTLLSENDRNKIGSNNSVIIDFFFGYTDCERVETDSLGPMLSNNDITFKNSSFRIVEDIATPGLLQYSSYQSSFWSNLNSYIVPLDISLWNINRLSSLIANVDICHQIFDYYRSQTPYNLSVNEGTELIPLAISFKLASNSTLSEIYKFQAKDESLVYFENEIDAGMLLNPSNVLSYFDLKNKKCHGNSVNYFTNVFNQIPIK